jgi:uncharacterized protein
MAHRYEEMLRESHAALRRGDMDAATKDWEPDIIWHFPGRGPFAGDYTGIPQFLAVLGRVMELTGGTYQTDVHDVVANDDHAVALLTVYAERNGKKLQENEALTIHMRDGKAAEVWILHTDQYGVDEFFA